MLTSGTRIGPYEIAAALGAGGMGEVYRAHDPRLGREVAIKVLRAGVGDRRRFELEARAASSLNHPNIVTVYDVGEEDGAPFIVSELLEGENLRGVLRGGALPVRTLLDIAVQVAAGLAAAHSRDLVHRDLKPENIIVLLDGRAKILDFGLAKQAAPCESDEDTHTARGALVGTIAYMSPEQAQGRAVDARSDQFSLGIILYEMATGTHPFRGTDRVRTMTAIAREEPAPAGALNATPPPLRWVIERCLAKEPGQRYTSTADLCAQLKDIRDHISEVLSNDAAQARVLAEAPKKRSHTFWFWMAAAVLAVAGVAAGAFLMQRAVGSRAYHYTPFATEAADETSPAWSRDGGTIAYTAVVNGVEQIFARRLDRAVAAQITSGLEACKWPFWSGDGARIYYWSGGLLWEIGAAGGEPRRVLSDAQSGSPPAAISPDGGTMAYFHADGGMNTVRLMRMKDGVSRVYDRAPFPGRFRQTGGMHFSPDGRKLLVWLIPDVDRGAELWVLPFPDGTPRRVNSPLLRGYRALTASWTADNRHIALATQPVPGGGLHIYLVDTATGEARHVTTGTSEEREPSVSPDGDRMAFASGSTNANLMEVSIDGRRVAPLLATSRREHSADWTPEGRQYVYVTEANGSPEIWLRSLEEGWARPVVEGSENGDLVYASPRLSPDGQKLAFVRVGTKHLVWIASVEGGQAVPLETECTDQHAPAWSPDGKWIAYTRYVGQRWEVAKAPSGGGGHPVRVAFGGLATSEIDWSKTGAIWFLTGRELFRVSESGGDAVSVAKDVTSYMLRKDGAAVYLIRQDRARGWQLTTLTVASGVEDQRVPLALDMDASVARARLHPDGTHFVVSVIEWKRDIWILDGLRPRGLMSLWPWGQGSRADEGVRH